MLRKKFSESLTARIFCITTLILLCSGTITFFLIAWATPITYTAIVNDDLKQQVDAFVDKLTDTSLDNCGPLLDAFIRSSGADAMLLDSDGQMVRTNSQLAIQTVYQDNPTEADAFNNISVKNDSIISWTTNVPETNDIVTVTLSEQNMIQTDVQFSNQEEHYSLCVIPRVKVENLAVKALIQMAPWLLLVLLFFSLLCALIYSRYITRPIVRISGIASQMAQLNFNGKCGEQRQDEIGVLSRSLDQMAQRLSTALKELETANQALRGEVERERELDRQRLSFFSAVSHELKTPVTILKGQLTGMLEGIDVYRDRDKYLLRSLQVATRMESLIEKMLSISRMETGVISVKQEPVELSTLITQQLMTDSELLKLRGQHLVTHLTPKTIVTGDAFLLGKAIGNLLSNASFYSPEGAEIRVWCGRRQGFPALTIENTDTHIQSDALPHLFEAFYRGEESRNRNTGGSGLGLYLVQQILKQHHTSCVIENTKDGVQASILFPMNRSLSHEHTSIFRKNRSTQ